MKNIRRVHGLECSKSLIDEILAMVVGEVLSPDHAVHISLHEFLDEIDLCECFVAPGLLDVKNRDDVLVVEVSKELHLSQGSQAEHGVIERSDLLDSNFLTRWFVERGTDDAICSLSYNILYVILLGDIEGDLARSGRRIRRAVGHPERVSKSCVCRGGL